MNIYVVQYGDSIWSISQRFGVNTNKIIALNNLYNLPGLVVGQALVIPSIAPTHNYGFIEVNSYIEPLSNQIDTQLIKESGRYLTYISPFSYRVTEDGNLIPLNDSDIISQSKTFKDAPVMVITNFRDGTFNTNLGHSILSNNDTQQKLINNVLYTMATKGYYGLNIDFERISPEDRTLYNNFLRKVVSELHLKNYSVSTSLAPKTSPYQTGAWYGAHDYPAHGEIVDYVILMTYEWGWSGGPPMAVAPIQSVRAVLNYAVSVIPRKKIMMGMPLYGYDWTLPYLPHASFAPRVSTQQAIGIAWKYGANITFDQKSKSPYINYFDEKGTPHIIWFEDARSIYSKLLLVNEYGLRGISYWELWSYFPQNWYVLDNMFHIVKVVT